MTQTQPYSLNRNALRVLVLFGAVMLVGGSDMTKVVVALPTLTQDLALSSTASLWIADAYPLAAGVVLVFSAVAADRFGRKRIYLLGLGLAIVSAVVAGFAPTGEFVIAARMGQGIGAAMLIAATVAMIRVTFPGLRLRALAYGVWVIGFSTGSALGPLIGGGLIELADWRWVFWINAPVLLICLVVAMLVLEESKNPDPPSLDSLSAALSGIGIGLFIAGLKATAYPEFAPWISPAALTVGAIAVVLFVVRQTRLSRPFLDIGLLTNALLASSAAVVAATVAVFNGVLYLLTQRYQFIDGLTAVESGIALLPLAVSSALGGIVGPVLQRRFTQQHIITASLAVVAAGFLLLATTEDPGELVGLIGLGLGAGIIMAIGANAIMSSAPEHRTADAGALQESAFALGAGAGIAGLGTLAIHYGVETGAGPVAAAIYGPGTETALGIGALLYVFFALAAGLIILNTIKDRARSDMETNQ